tara:strand:- start:4 stop:483 length:480 start_codon:yes stop_codon:yes gene_type:complete
MSLNILENSNIKEYINPNFDTFNCNTLNLSGVSLTEKQSYTVSTSNLENLSYANPISDFYYEILGTNVIKITGGLDCQMDISTSFFGFEITLPPGITYTPGNKAYGASYSKRIGATRSAGLRSQPIITASNTLLIEYVRGITFSAGNTFVACVDMYIEL